MTVGPTVRRQTHHLSLTDGINVLNLMLANRKGEPDPKGWQRANSPKTSLRVTSGNEGYGDLELPFSSIVQADWSGGRAARDFEKDTTRYSDGYRCDTNRAGEFRCGPLATQGSGYNSTYTSSTGTTLTSSYTGNSSVYEYAAAARFTTGAAIAVRGINLSVGITNSPSPKITVHAEIFSHDAGNNTPNALLTTSSVNIIGTKNTTTLNYDAAIEGLSFPVSVSLSASTVYWIHIYAEADESRVGEYYMTMNYYRGTSSGNRILKHFSTPSWEETYNNATISFGLQTTGYGRSLVFDYRGRKLAVTQSDDQTAPKLWILGYHGAAKDNASDKSKLNTSLNLTGVDLVGKYARIISGPGSAEETPWRKIVSNTATGTNDVITVAPAWNITHTTATEFVIQGCTNWQEITSTAGSGTSMAIKGMSTYLTAPVTDVLALDDIIYFCQGESVAIARTRFNAGVWSDMAADGTNKFTFLELVQDEKGEKKVWGAKRGAATVAESDKKAWASNLAFGAELVCGDTSSQITGLLAAKISGPMLPVVFKETEFGSVSGSGDDKIYDTYYQFPEARDDFNGRSAIQPDVYLWFSLMDGLQRYYDQRLDDTGPNRDEGMPKTRKGRISYMVKYFSQIYAAYDAGRYGYSSILRWNGTGWCEMYRGVYGRRIRALNVDVLPDLDNADRLWFSEEEDIYYIPIALDPDKTEGYTYFTGSQVETAWIFGPYRDITKYWDTLAIFAKNLTANITVTVEYKTDTDSNAWTALPTSYTTSPMQENTIATLRNVSGKCIKFRITLNTNNTAISPVVTAVRVNAVIRVKPKAVWSVTCLATDGKLANVQKILEEGDVKTVVDRLEVWQDGQSFAVPLTASFWHSLNDQKRGFVDGVSSSPIEVEIEPGVANINTMLINFNFIEV